MQANWKNKSKNNYRTIRDAKPTLPLTTTSSAWSCLHLSQARSYCIDRKLRIKLSSASFSPTITNSSWNPGNMPASCTCLILWMHASCIGKYAEDFAVISTRAPLASIEKTVPLIWKKRTVQTTIPSKYYYIKKTLCIFRCTVHWRLTKSQEFKYQ